MEKVTFLDRDCICEKVISNKILDKLDIFTYTAKNHKFGQKQTNGKFKIVDELEIAIAQLTKGKAVHYKGFIYFLREKTNGNRFYDEFKNTVKRVKNSIDNKMQGEYQNYLNGVLYQSLLSQKDFAMVKSMISLFEMKILSSENLEKKLKQYIKNGSFQSIQAELESIQRVG